MWYEILQAVMLLSNLRSIGWTHHGVMVSLHHSFTENPSCDETGILYVTLGIQEQLNQMRS